MTKFTTWLISFSVGFICSTIIFINLNLGYKQELESLKIKTQSIIGGVRAIDSEFRKIYRAGNMDQVNEAILHADHIRSGLKAILEVGK